MDRERKHRTLDTPRKTYIVRKSEPESGGGGGHSSNNNNNRTSSKSHKRRAAESSSSGSKSKTTATTSTTTATTAASSTPSNKERTLRRITKTVDKKEEEDDDDDDSSISDTNDTPERDRIGSVKDYRRVSISTSTRAEPEDESRALMTTNGVTANGDGTVASLQRRYEERGTADLNAGRYRDAEALLAKALAYSTPSDPKKWMICTKLSRAIASQGEFAEAKLVLEAAEKELKEANLENGNEEGEVFAAQIAMRMQMVEVCILASEPDEAEDICWETMTDVRDHCGPDHRLFFKTMLKYFDIMTTRKEHEDELDAMDDDREARQAKLEERRKMRKKEKENNNTSTLNKRKEENNSGTPMTRETTKMSNGLATPPSITPERERPRSIDTQALSRKIDNLRSSRAATRLAGLQPQNQSSALTRSITSRLSSSANAKRTSMTSNPDNDHRRSRRTSTHDSSTASKSQSDERSRSRRSKSPTPPPGNTREQPTSDRIRARAAALTRRSRSLPREKTSAINTPTRTTTTTTITTTSTTKAPSSSSKLSNSPDERRSRFLERDKDTNRISIRQRSQSRDVVPGTRVRTSLALSRTSSQQQTTASNSNNSMPTSPPPRSTSRMFDRPGAGSSSSTTRPYSTEGGSLLRTRRNSERDTGSTRDRDREKEKEKEKEREREKEKERRKSGGFFLKRRSGR